MAINRGIFGPSQAPVRYGEENEAAALVNLVSNDITEDTIIFKIRNPQYGRNPIGSGAEYGLGQVWILLDESNGSRAGATRARLDGYGGLGLAGGLHLATGLNQTDPAWNGAAGQTVWCDHSSGPAPVGMHAFVVSPVTAMTGQYYAATNVAGTAFVFSVGPVSSAGPTALLALYNDTGAATPFAVYGGTTAAFGFRMGLFSQIAAEIPLLIRLAAAQSGDAIAVQNSTPANIFRVTGSGTVVLVNTSTTGSSSSSPAVTSGVAFTPNASFDALVYVQIAGAASGTVSATWGPSTGAENNICTTVAVPLNTSELITVRIPAANKMKVTVVNATITQTRVVTA